MLTSCRLRPAYAADIPAMGALWRQVFGDSEEVTDAFYRAFPRCRAAMAENGAGEIISVVHTLPQTLVFPGGTLPVAYLYAIATRKDCRGQGVASALVRFTEALLERLGYAIAVLTPAEPSLFAFYAKLGYVPAFTRSRTPFPGGTEISAEEYRRRREELLDLPHIAYGLDTFRYLETAYGVKFYETATGVAAAGENYTAEVLPEDLGGKPFAMAKWLSKPRPLPQGYLGFALE